MPSTHHKNPHLQSTLPKAENRTATPTRPQRKSHLLATIALFTTMLLSAIAAHPQGCTQCQDNTAATPPKTQAAYRHAIILLTVAAGCVFFGTLVLLKRHH